jgi:hypothetical protein
MILPDIINLHVGFGLRQEDKPASRLEHVVMLHCAYVVTTCDINKFVIIAACDSAVQRSRKTHVLALVPTLAALGFVGEVRRKQLLPASAALPKGSGPGSRPAATSASRNHRAEVDRRADHQRARADRPPVFTRYPRLSTKTSHKDLRLNHCRQKRFLVCHSADENFHGPCDSGLYNDRPSA